ncbi:GATA zinc finger domain-containing protein 1 [Anopheles nili]|uniref:GATA zinc finger domain-containing protein 1 n=1 Tax=Anopheles nili TaxID=185578 RepID=UPI00237A741C|nr:GATA zinc finger domain-containing protein 1 [Anopheles nili]
MPPKVQRCSICGTIETARWYILDRRSICSECHDIQLNPPLEPLYERSTQRAGSRERDEPVDEDCKAAPEGQKIRHDFETPKKLELAKQPSREFLDNATNADPDGGPEDNEEVPERVAANGMFSPRRLRRRVCPVRAPVRRGTKKTGRGCHASKAKSRRTLLKKVPIKTPRETASTRSVPKLLHENTWYQIGDIVSMIDTKDNTYYAQVRGLIVDAYNEKSAVLTWLIPTTSSPPANEGFEPATYLVGPDEDIPRRLSFMNFVMHAPSDYYLDRNNPYPRPDCYGPMNTTQRDNRNYVWATIAHLHHGEK